jgi:hypothetical protein
MEDVINELDNSLEKEEIDNKNKNEIIKYLMTKFSKENNEKIKNKE